jgi:hypothetical protein
VSGARFLVDKVLLPPHISVAGQWERACTEVESTPRYPQRISPGLQALPTNGT